MIGPVMLQGINQVMPETSTIKAHEDAKPMIDQTGMVAQGQKEVDQKQEQVVRRDDPSLGQDKHDAKEKGKNEYYNPKQDAKKNGSKSDGTVKSKGPSRGFDVKI